MKFSLRRPVLAAAGALVLCVLAIQPPTVAQSSGAREHWVGTWSTSEVGRPQTPPPPAAPAAAAPPPAPYMHFNNQTLRQIVHTSVGGSRMRVVFSNVF